VAAPFFLPELASQCRDWLAVMHAMLNAAIDQVDPRRGTIAFADPTFGPEHALFASDACLWRFENGRPTDPKVAERARYCEDRGIIGFDALAIECASLGHPSPVGAARYADATIQAARSLGVFGGSPV
jgi:hypothetical protein